MYSIIKFRLRFNSDGKINGILSQRLKKVIDEFLNERVEYKISTLSSERVDFEGNPSKRMNFKITLFEKEKLNHVASTLFNLRLYKTPIIISNCEATLIDISFEDYDTDFDLNDVFNIRFKSPYLCKVGDSFLEDIIGNLFWRDVYKSWDFEKPSFSKNDFLEITEEINIKEILKLNSIIKLNNYPIKGIKGIYEIDIRNLDESNKILIKKYIKNSIYKGIGLHKTFGFGEFYLYGDTHE